MFPQFREVLPAFSVKDKPPSGMTGWDISQFPAFGSSAAFLPLAADLLEAILSR
jgi:hypothetical protein